MRFRPADCLRRVSGALRMRVLPTACRHVCLFLFCVGLGAVAALAPFGVARMRVPGPSGGSGVAPKKAPHEHLRTPEAASCEMLKERFRVLVDGQVLSLEKNYDMLSDTGLWSWEKEAARSRYLRAWAEGRGLKIIEAKAQIEVDAVTPEDPETVWVELTEHALYTYAKDTEAGSPSAGEPPWTHTFGSRAVHVVELVLREGDWKIRRDWYADPIGHECHLPPCEYVPLSEAEPPGAPAGSDPSSQEDGPSRGGEYDRQAALEYAIRYAGVPAVEGSGKYNPDYRVYTFLGGDCANFASQVLHAGGLKQGYGWHYTSEGSSSWVRGEDLIWHLLSTGRGKRIYTGTFAGAVKRTPEHPSGVVATLEPGDIIGYETKGQVCHVAVVIGKDPRGYVTIASHTTDRLFFPWDMGWNDQTVFWFVKITV